MKKIFYSLLFLIFFLANSFAASVKSEITAGSISNSDLNFTALNAANNLSDIINVPSARNNLSLGSMAIQPANSVTITGGTINDIENFNVLGSALRLNDGDNSHSLQFIVSNLTTERTFTIDTGDANRTITLTGNPTLSDWFNQGVKTSSTVSFVNLNLTGGAIPANGFYLDDVNTLGFSTGNALRAALTSSGLYLYSNFLGLKQPNDPNHGIIHNATVNGLEYRGFAGHTWRTGASGATELMQLDAASLDLNVPLISTVVTGTAPLVIASTTKVANFNSDLLDDQSGAYYLDAANFTGILGVSKGGTGTATQLTAGSAVFAGTSGVYTQDNSNFFWNDTNNRLGIGTATPQAKIETTGFIRSTGNDSTPTSGSGLEFLYNTGNSQAFLQAYNRTGSAYLPLNLEGSVVNINPNSAGTLAITGNTGITGGNLAINTAGKGIEIKSGANSKAVTGTLNGTTNVTVNNTSITSNSKISCFSDGADGIAQGAIILVSKSVGSNFVVKSSNASDTSAFACVIYEFIP